jgi:hypothetical protein
MQIPLNSIITNDVQLLRFLTDHTICLTVFLLLGIETAGLVN